MMRTPLTDLEQSIAGKVAGASFPPATASKRFARDLGSGYIKELSDKGRKFLAFVAHRYRRQYPLTPEERAWIDEWLSKEIPVASKPTSETAQRSTDGEGKVDGKVSSASGQASLFGDN